ERGEGYQRQRGGREGGLDHAVLQFVIDARQRPFALSARSRLQDPNRAARCAVARVRAMAKPTTATRRPSATSAATRRATRRMRSRSATEVPPNFITSRDKE